MIPQLPASWRALLADEFEKPYFHKLQEFVREVLAEFRKVTWPSRAELVNSTAVVIVVTVVLAFFLGGVDVVLARVVERILR